MSSDVEHLLRWERSGGVWRVVARSRTGAMTLVLESCDGEEMERLTTTQADVSELVGQRRSSVD